MTLRATISPDLFRDMDRLFIGYDRLVRSLLDEQSVSQKYPPYNVERVEDNKFRITLAVAGFRQDEIEVTQHNKNLTIVGTKNLLEDTPEGHEYLWRGIAERNFRRQFVLDDYIHVISVDMSDGLLVIELQREVPEELKPRRWEIGYKS